MKIKQSFNTGWGSYTDRHVYLVPEVGTAQDFGNIPFTCTLPVQTTGDKPAKLPQGFYGCIHVNILSPVRR